MEPGNEAKPLLNKVGQSDIQQTESFYQSISASINSCSFDGRSYASRKGFTRSVYSVTSHGTLVTTLTERLSGDAKSTLFMTICNMLPALQGSAVFGMPFAVMVGGFTFLPAAVLLCIMADITGILMADCLYETCAKSGIRRRVHATYLDVSCACFGKFGGACVNALNMIYLTANNVVNVVLMSQCVYDVIGNHVSLSQTHVTMIFSLLLIPLLFIRTLSALAYVSLIGVLSIVVGSFVSLFIFVQNYAQWSFNYHQIPLFSSKHFPLAIAILMYSTLLTAILPEIEGSMRNTKQVNSALHISYTLSTLFKLLFGVLGALTFGADTQQLVALNVSNLSSVAKYILIITLCLYAITNFALMYIIFYRQIDNLVEQKLSPRVQGNLIYVFASRILGIVVCVAIALVVPYFALVSGVVGAVVGTIIAFALPVVFHLKLKWKQLSLFSKLSEILLLTAGLMVGCVAIYSSTSALIDAVRETK